MLEFKYRPDVDGLRAVAVALVLLFHAGLGFSGGFIGVDVFFVISGFLITGLILKEQAAGNFSLGNFWVRRVRRILPAATVMAVTVLMAGSVLLLPEELVDLSQSTIAQQLMSANVYFWRSTNYFDGPADLKPLLHTWSLAVEEQFYLGYPFLLLLLRRRATVPILGILTVGSFALSVWGVRHHPAASFYLLPTRAWELLIGGMICFLPKPSRLPPWSLATSSWLSLGAIVAAGWCYSSTTPFPGTAALLPCLATGALIYANSERLSQPASLLAARPVVFAGLLSYSLYLWHWPIFAFWRIWLGEPTPAAAVALLGISAGVAYASWKYIETPFRRPNPARPRAAYYRAALLSVAATSLMAVGIVAAKGLPLRFPKEINTLADNPLPTAPLCTVEDAERGEFPAIGAPADGTPLVVLWGDSHLISLFDALHEAMLDADLHGVCAAYGGFPPLLDAWSANRRTDDILRWNRAVFKYIQSHNVSDVVLAARWTIYVEGRENGDRDMLLVDRHANTERVDFAAEALRRSLQRTIQSLRDSGVRIWVLKQVPSQRGDPARQLILARLLRDNTASGTSRHWNTLRHRKANSLLGQLQSDDVLLLDPWPYCFDNAGNSIIFNGDRCLYNDDNHLSAYGGNYLLRSMFQDWAQRVAKREPTPHRSLATRRKQTR